MASPQKTKINSNHILSGIKGNILELSYVNLSDDDGADLDNEDISEKKVPKKEIIQDFDTFKKQFNIREILDKLVVKREFFIPSKAMDINEFYLFEKVKIRQ